MAPLRLLPLLVLAGCAAPEARDAASLRAAMANSQASLAAVSPFPLLPTAAPLAVAAAAPERAPAGAGTPPAEGAPRAAAALLGLGPQALRRHLGEPSLRRAEGGAEIWLYTAEGCALDLVLYPAGGGLRVAHAAARASGVALRTEAECLREIAGTAPRPPPALIGAAAGAGTG
ncbi:hypothetical protein [Crenalkalicoccus roseus]|uniref:hypothetical protein n=1 Tax=Crenalkalicoccus roseus TaxID=1485588 RepID=UPI001863CA01|nr:hypothetical protein [Crenalkalicoccus roseus]